MTRSLRRVVRYFAKSNRVTVAVFVVIVGFGALAYSVLLPREGYPNVALPLVVIEGTASGIAEERADEAIVLPIVRALQPLEDVDRITSFTDGERIRIYVESVGGVAPAALLDDVASLIEDLEAKLDEALAVDLEVRSVQGSRYLERYDLLIGLYGPNDAAQIGAQAARLQATADEVAPRLAADPHLQAITERVEVIDLFADGEAEPATSYGYLTVRSESGNELRPSIAIGVAVRPGHDLLALRSAVDEALKSSEVTAVLPDGFGMAVGLDGSKTIGRQLRSLQMNIVVGLVLVSVVSFVLISWRVSLITALFVPTVVAATAGLLYLAGITLNTVSLFGIILALGLFVDDAIVMTEAIDATRAEGGSEFDVIDRAVGRVGRATVSGTATTILVFAPMLAITGILGVFIRILPAAVILALVASLILSLVVVPAAARVMLLRGGDEPGAVVPVRSGFVERRLAPALARPIEATGERGTAVAVAALTLCIACTAIGLFVFAPKVGFNIFPRERDSTEIAAQYRFAADTNMEDAQRLTRDVSGIAMKLLGDDLVAGFTYSGSVDEARTQLTLTDVGQRRPVPDLVEQVLGPEGLKIDDVLVAFAQISAGPPEAVFPFTVQVFHEDVQVASAAARDLRAFLVDATILRKNGSDFSVLQAEVTYGDSIARRGDRRYVEVHARFDATDTSTALASARRHVIEHYSASRLAALGIEADGLGFDFGLESRKEESFATVPRAFAMALVAIFVLLVIQFRSISQWLLVASAVPLSFFGVFGGLWLTGHDMSFFVMLGLLGLIGIVVNNTILLTDYANQERARGLESRAAVANAVRSRLRPLLATMFTTVAGLLPLALTDPLWESLGFTIVFGLLSSTLLVLIGFPYLYLGLEHLRDRVVTPWRPSTTWVDSVKGSTSG